MTNYDDNPYASPKAELEFPEDEAPKSYDSIGGWLILFGIGILLNPISLGLSLVRDILPVFSEPLWSTFTSPDGEYYRSWTTAYVFSGLGTTLLMLAWSIVNVFLFFGKRRLGPRSFIGFLLLHLVVRLIDVFAIAELFGDDPIVVEVNKDLIRAVVGCCAWIPYFMVSKRVAGTFVR